MLRGSPNLLVSPTKGTDCMCISETEEEGNQQKHPTSTVVLTDITTTVVGVLPLCPVTQSQTSPPIKQSVPTALDTNWVAQERLRDQMMREVRQLQTKLKEPTPTPLVAPSGNPTPLKWDTKALPQHDEIVSEAQPNHTMETPQTT